MDTRFCTVCKNNKAITRSTKLENGTRHILTCGHNFIEVNLTDTIHASEEFQIKKLGEVNEKVRKGDRPLDPNYATKFIEYGDIDFEAAKILFEIQDREYDFMNQAAFLCAQATEKYLKAFLFFNASQLYPNFSSMQILDEFKKLSHNLLNILNVCQQVERGFEKYRDKIKIIDQYSLLKYPDVEDSMVYSDTGLSISSEISTYVKEISAFTKNLCKRV